MLIRLYSFKLSDLSVRTAQAPGHHRLVLFVELMRGYGHDLGQLRELEQALDVLLVPHPLAPARVVLLAILGDVVEHDDVGDALLGRAKRGLVLLQPVLALLQEGDELIVGHVPDAPP